MENFRAAVRQSKGYFGIIILTILLAALTHKDNVEEQTRSSETRHEVGLE
jgi:hypothetical protein